MSELVEIGQTSRRNCIFREENEVGGHRYWSDSIGGGVVVWDTSIVSPEELEFALDYEKRIVGNKAFLNKKNVPRNTTFDKQCFWQGFYTGATIALSLILFWSFL